MYQWVQVIDRLDEILGDICQKLKETKWTHEPILGDDRKLTLAILTFTETLLQNVRNSTLYNSYEVRFMLSHPTLNALLILLFGMQHLDVLLETNDLALVEVSLRILVTIIRHVIAQWSSSSAIFFGN